MNNAFIPTMIGYIGALSMVVGFAYYVLNEIEISWTLVEVLGYLVITGLFSMPFLHLISNELQFPKFTSGVLRLTSFLGVIGLPILIILSLQLHVPKGDNFALAGSIICTVTATFSLYYAQLLDSDIIAFYGVAHTWAAFQFVVAQFLKGDHLDGFSYITISSITSLMFVGFSVFILSQTNEYEKYCQYAVVLGLVTYILTGSLRGIFEPNLMDFILIVSIIGFYYCIDCNPTYKYVEIPLNLSTAVYVFSKLFHLWTKTNLPVALILSGAVLYGFSLFYQMRHAKTN